MPTSSIFTSIIIDISETEKFIDVFEKSNRDPTWKPTTPIVSLTDTEEIRRLMAKKTDK